MVKLDKIYTRGGDQGETSLGDGSRVKKYSARPTAYGDVDEANAVIGLARLHSKDNPEIDGILSRVQNDLFDVGADLATPEKENPKYPPLRITSGQVARLEEEIDGLNADLTALTSFILPGGSELASYLHLARTIVRRAERMAVQVADDETINEQVVKYLNRLSDLLFVMSRYVNNKGADDVLWVPGDNR